MLWQQEDISILFSVLHMRVSCHSLMCRLGIPDTEYAATIKMPSTEFARICKYVPCPALRLKW